MSQQMKVVLLNPNVQAVLDRNMLERESGREEMIDLRKDLWIHDIALDFYSKALLKNRRIPNLKEKYSHHRRLRGKCLNRLRIVENHHKLWTQKL